ncbi:flagellar biosynthetic protein FliO [Corallincola luteus]|uniref:Flagellar protein n=1 Tax=Corallincola luteus TaxID=1775177 RepID=A0ABY2AQB9_9GAMM|nr:flagellar biosynthetic protein FliO [Corallincola luteus]TCI05385.1 flagellar biosynthetic protein FliO [Corallincola luteus]
MSIANLLLFSAPVVAQPSAGGGVATSQLLSLLFSLITVLAIILILAWLLRRFNIGAGGGRGAMKVVATLALGRNERVVLVSLGDKQLLLGVTGQQINLLHTFDEPISLDTADSAQAMPLLFQEKLRGFLNKTEKS